MVSQNKSQAICKLGFFAILNHLATTQIFPQDVSMMLSPKGSHSV
jgi:hypothetical protein